MPTPNWLSGWVKMNSKHVVYSAQNNNTEKPSEKCELTATTAAHTTPSFDETSRTARERSGPPRQRSWKKSKSNGELQTGVALRETSENISRQVLKEAAFMADVDEDELPAPPQTSAAPLHAPVQAKPRISPLGLTVTTVNSDDDSNRKHGQLFLGLAAIFKGEQDRVPCQSCESLEKKLNAALCDVEYLRFARLQLLNKDCDEYDDFGLGHTVFRADGASSKELEEIERRHKQHIQSLVAERSRYQQVMESELQKYDSKCRVLSREVIWQEREKVALQHKLETTQCERDALEQELVRIRKALKTLEASQVDCTQPKQNYHRDAEERELLEATEVIEPRDQVIQDLSAQLQTALDQLELERKKHKQTRHVMQTLWPSAIMKDS